MKILPVLLFLPFLLLFTGCCQTKKDVTFAPFAEDSHYETSGNWVTEDGTFPIRSGMTRTEVDRVATPIDLAGRTWIKGDLRLPIGYITPSKEHYDVIFDHENAEKEAVVIAVYKSRPVSLN